MNITQEDRDNLRTFIMENISDGEMDEGRLELMRKLGKPIATLGKKTTKSVVKTGQMPGMAALARKSALRKAGKVVA